MNRTAHVVTMQYARKGSEGLSMGPIFFKHNMFPGNYSLHMHDCYEIEIVTEGAGMQWINGKAYEFTRGSLFFLSPDDYHRFQSDSPVKLISIKLSEIDLQPALLQILHENHGGVFLQLLSNDESKYLQLFGRIEEELINRTQYAEQRIYAYLMLLLTGLLKSGERVGHTTETDQIFIRYIRKAIEYIHSYYASPITLKDVADYCGLSIYYFSSLFSKHVGCNFSTYLIEFRIRRAKKMISTTDQPVTDIAYACGFGSLANFERMFKKQTNLSPNAYRRGGIKHS